MKPVASILALVLAITPALAFAGPKDKAPHHGKHAVHAGQTHHVARSHAQPVAHKTAATKADAKKGAKDVVPASHKTSSKAAPAKAAVAKPDAKAPVKKAAPKATDVKKDEPLKTDVIPAVAMTPAHDAKGDVEKKKHLSSRIHRAHKK